jgi:predicted kinase
MDQMNEKAVSKMQQRLFGMAYNYLKLKNEERTNFINNIRFKYGSDLADKIIKIVNEYKSKHKKGEENYIKKIAKTKRKNLPNKINDNLILNFNDFINESLNDKQILKAIFIIGCPGSGKSEYAKYFNDIFKIIDVDVPTMFNLKTSNLDSDLTKISDKTVDDIRMKSKKQSNSMLINSMNNLLPLILDCTGRESLNIENKNSLLKKYGYDTYMIFINTDLNVAKNRNKNRNRKVSDEFIGTSYCNILDNIEYYKNMFDSNFYTINNTDNDLKNVYIKLKKIQNEILNKKNTNETGIEIIQFLKTTKKSHLSDYDETFKDLKL